jgi:hypothetical protein
MLLMRADTLRGHVGGGWALEIGTFSSFLGLVKWLRAVRRVPFGAQKRAPPPTHISIVYTHMNSSQCNKF